MPLRTIIGHRRILDLLSRSIAGGSLPPSLVFSGPAGVGKRTVALAAAQTLNCTATRSAGAAAGGTFQVDACGECAACKRIARGVHPDVLVVGPGETGSIKIDQVREALDRAMYRPFEGRRRVTIIDDADVLVAGAQNALLKTLEEPPASSVFILVTSRPDALLPTVRSRCSQIRFGRLRSADVAEVLERDHEYAKREALAVAASSDGSVGRALHEEAEQFSDARADVKAMLRPTPGRSDSRMKLERGKDLVKGGGATAASERDYLGLRLQTLSSLARDLSLLVSHADSELLANIDLRDELEGLAKSYDAERALGLFAAVDRAQDALDHNVSPKVVADWLALQV
jgi:DNA polymerase-3 subunit delta'